MIIKKCVNRFPINTVSTAHCRNTLIKKVLSP